MEVLAVTTRVDSVVATATTGCLEAEVVVATGVVVASEEAEDLGVGMVVDMVVVEEDMVVEEVDTVAGEDMVEEIISTVQYIPVVSEVCNRE